MIRKLVISIGLFAGVAGAAELTFLQPTDEDAVRATLPAQPKAAGPLFNDAREPVSLAWSIAADAQLDFARRPFEAESRQYYLDVTASNLAEGVTLHTTAPRALIRLSPAAGQKALGLSRESLVLTTAGKSFDAQAGIETFADEAAMKATGAGFSAGTIAFRLNDALGSGPIELRFEGLAKTAAGRFVIQVFEPESTQRLRVRAAANRFETGDAVRLAVDVEGAVVRARDLRGYVSAPDGREIGRLVFEAQADGQIVGVLPKLDGMTGPAPGLFEAHVFLDTAEGSKRLLRDARTAFDAGTATARLNGEVGELALDAGLAFDLGVEAGTAGRFEVRGVLFGTLADGRLVPVAAAHSAAWLEPGSGQIRVTVDDATLADSPAAAPYEFRHVELIDQSRMQTLWRQARAVLIQL